MRHRVTVAGVLPLERGGALRDVEVEVRTWGRYRPNATLVCHALTGDADADTWWRGLFGPGRLLDPAERFVVAMSVLGGCAGTTGPPSVDPATGRRYGPHFPEVTIRDMVRLQRLVLRELGVHRLDVAIGGSMGGMQVLEWAVMFPDVVASIVPIAVGAAQSAWAVGLSEAQRHAIVTDPAFAEGHYVAQPAAGLATARMMAMCTYRSPQSFSARFGRGGDPAGFAVQSYLRHHGERLVERFDANAYLRLIAAMDSHDLGRERGPLEAILHRIETRALVIGIDSDVLYPLDEVRALADGLANADFGVLESAHGHDAFLVDTDAIDDLVRPFVAAGVTASAGA